MYRSYTFNKKVIFFLILKLDDEPNTNGCERSIPHPDVRFYFSIFIYILNVMRLTKGGVVSQGGK